MTNLTLISSQLTDYFPTLPAPPIELYLVGGAVRDLLLGKQPKDLDYLVCKADASVFEDFLGVKNWQQVGADFPVFLHPETGFEYALARTERQHRDAKTTNAHKNFLIHSSKDISVQEDLMRRDLTINAMALDSQGQIIDPFGGQQDLANKILRATSLAFCEDPLRILRLARFWARLGPQWQIHEDTKELCKRMVAQQAHYGLPFERVLAELIKGAHEPYFHQMAKFLNDIGFDYPHLHIRNDAFGLPAIAQMPYLKPSVLLTQTILPTEPDNTQKPIPAFDIILPRLSQFFVFDKNPKLPTHSARFDKTYHKVLSFLNTSEPYTTQQLIEQSTPWLVDMAISHSQPKESQLFPWYCAIEHHLHTWLQRSGIASIQRVHNACQGLFNFNFSISTSHDPMRQLTEYQKSIEALSLDYPTDSFIPMLKSQILRAFFLLHQIQQLTTFNVANLLPQKPFDQSIQAFILEKKQQFLIDQAHAFFDTLTQDHGRRVPKIK